MLLPQGKIYRAWKVGFLGDSKMWRILHKMYEIYDKIPSRLSREGFKLTCREKDSIWFDVVFIQQESEKRIEFYVSTSEIWAKKLREILENYMKVTVEEVETFALKIPDNNEIVPLLFVTE